MTTTSMDCIAKIAPRILRVKLLFFIISSLSINSYAQKECVLQCLTVKLNKTKDSIAVENIRGYSIEVQFQNKCIDTCEFIPPRAGRETNGFKLYFDLYEVKNGDTIASNIRPNDFDDPHFILDPETGEVNYYRINLKNNDTYKMNLQIFDVCNIHRKGDFIFKGFYREFYKCNSARPCYNSISLGTIAIKVY